MVRPSYYDHHLPFEEFMISQLMASLATEDEVYRSRPIEDIAAALTRRLLRQTLRGLGPAERLFAQSPSRWNSLRFLFGSADRACKVIDGLIAALDAASLAPSLAHLVKHHGFTPQQCFRLIHGHLNLHEPGPDVLAVLRRRFYAAMAQSALLGQQEPLFHLLEGEYGDIGTATTTRFETVARLLHVVTEVCALVRQPIVLAFDNLERLFSPQNQFDGDLVRAFFNSLAQAVDNTKGILVLLFAESGLFDRASAFMDEFAQHRLLQGVPVYGRGPTNIIRLKSPGVDDVRTLVKNRMGELLAGSAVVNELPEVFPFDEQSLQSAAIEREPLRSTLVRLRNQYSARVYERPAMPEKAPTIAWESLLETNWRDQLQAAARKLETGLAGQLQNVHAGLGALLKQLLPLSVDSWLLTEVHSTASIGDNPTYGLVSLLTWVQQSPTDSNGKPLTIGVGFLLAKKGGMPHDLRSKFDFFRRPRKGDRLLVFWPTPSDSDNLVQALPTGTRAVWDGSRHKNDVTLRRIGNDELCTFLAAADWLSAVAIAADQPVPPEVVQSFIKEKCQSLLQLIAPPLSQLERVGTDED